MLKKQQWKDINKKLLEELKNDEVILSKIDFFQMLLQEYQNLTSQEPFKLKEEFIKWIDYQIKSIDKNDKEQEEIKITLYEKEGEWIKTAVQNSNNEISLEILRYKEYLQLSFQDLKNGKKFLYEKTPETTDCTFEDGKEPVKKVYSFSMKEKLLEDNRKTNKDITITYEDNSNQIEMTCQQNINLVNNLKNEIQFNEKNAINLNNLEDENFKIIWDRVVNVIFQEVNEITNTRIAVDDVLKVLQIISEHS